MDIFNDLRPIYDYAKNNNLIEWAYFFISLAIIYYSLKLSKNLIIQRLSNKTYENIVLNLWKLLLSATTRMFFLAVALNFGTRFSHLPTQLEGLIQKISMIAFWIQVSLWLSAGIKFCADRYIERKRLLDQSAVTAASMGFFGARVMVFILILLLMLDNIGFDVTTLIASLGIGGIAIALAVQNILGDLLASLSITLDKPFVVGDFIVMDDFMGTVENIGLKTTRIRSLNGEQIIFSNAELLKGRIRNYKRMLERRAVFSFTLRHDTPHNALSRIPDEVKNLINSLSNTRLDRCHFFKISELGFVFETVYLVLTPDYNQYMDIQQKINLKLFELLSKLNANFAFSLQLTPKEIVA